MKLSEFKKFLSDNQDKAVVFVLPTGTRIPPHAHVTDVARIDKRFIDCGGTFRTESFCRLQTWFSDDTDHRVGAKMLFKVLEKAAPFLETEELEVDVEYEAPFISQFPISKVQIEGRGVVVSLGMRHTTCLAPDKCVPTAPKKDNVLFKSLTKLQPTKCC